MRVTQLKISGRNTMLIGEGDDTVVVTLLAAHTGMAKIGVTALPHVKIGAAISDSEREVMERLSHVETTRNSSGRG